jgi:hypothetical protein
MKKMNNEIQLLNNKHKHQDCKLNQLQEEILNLKQCFKFLKHLVLENKRVKKCWMKQMFRREILLIY